MARLWGNCTLSEVREWKYLKGEMKNGIHDAQRSSFILANNSIADSCRRSSPLAIFFYELAKFRFFLGFSIDWKFLFVGTIRCFILLLVDSILTEEKWNLNELTICYPLSTVKLPVTRLIGSVKTMLNETETQ